MNYEKVIVKWKEFEIPDVLNRDISVNINHNLITSIIGPRRAGKTYLCFLIITKLIKKGVNKSNILYINFEDEKLLGATASDLDKLLDMFYELTELDNKQNIYLFLDEIQNVVNWDSWVRRIHDTEKNIKIVITGSSSKLLSKEISTKLRGRTINHEIFPLSFKELLKWNNINYDVKTISHSKKKVDIKKLFKKYLMGGGYPAIINNNIPAEQLLKSYYEVMILRDIVERHKVKEVKKLRTISKLLLESVSSEFSYNKLHKRLKSLGFNISKNTIIEYLSYFEDAYLFFINLKYEYSLAKQIGSIKKIYCIDNGLINSVSFKFSENIGKLMENLVYIELKRKEKDIFYNKDSYECDFIIKEKNRVVGAIQVTKEIGNHNQQRELNGLIEALNKFKLKKGTILTYNSEDEKIINGKKIKIIPLWKWLLL